MTNREKAIVMAYTGVSMLVSEKFSIFHKYIEDLLGRPIWTHELATEAVWNEIKEKSKPDFLKLCAECGERPQGEWIDYSEGYVECPICNHLTNCDGNIDELHYCWNCGADMRKEVPDEVADDKYL